MTKETIVTIAHKRLNKYGSHDKRQVELYFNEFIATMNEVLKQGEPITLRGFGSFTFKTTPARPVRNFKTGETIMMEERKVIKFKKTV